MNSATVAIASDHRGVLLKNHITEHLQFKGLKVLDLGPFSSEPVDYADYANKVAEQITRGAISHGVLICGSGIGMSIAANRHRQVRAAVCDNPKTVQLTREHNDANVLALPGSSISDEQAIECVDIFLDTEFAGGRHLRRIAKLA